MRKSLIASIAATVAMGFGLVATAQAAKITATSWGGAYTAAQQKAVKGGICHTTQGRQVKCR